MIRRDADAIIPDTQFPAMFHMSLEDESQLEGGGDDGRRHGDDDDDEEEDEEDNDERRRNGRGEIRAISVRRMFVKKRGFVQSI